MERSQETELGGFPGTEAQDKGALLSKLTAKWQAAFPTP
jgi:hypothetical protein